MAKRFNLHIQVPAPKKSVPAQPRPASVHDAVERLIDALSAPLPAQQDDHGQQGQRDDRSAGQRRHDRLLEAGLRLLRSDTLPDRGGVPVTVLAHLDADQLGEQTGLAETAHGDLITVAELLHLAAEAQTIPVVLLRGNPH